MEKEVTLDEIYQQNKRILEKGKQQRLTELKKAKRKNLPLYRWGRKFKQFFF